MEPIPLHFFDHPIDPVFDVPPTLEKSPSCPNGFIWESKTYRVIEMLSSWTDFTRRGKMTRNMRPEHAALASSRGSLNVGRFYFRVKVNSGQIFDIYYDRAMKNVDDRKGHSYLIHQDKIFAVACQSLAGYFSSGIDADYFDFFTDILLIGKHLRFICSTWYAKQKHRRLTGKKFSFIRDQIQTFRAVTLDIPKLSTCHHGSCKNQLVFGFA
jgi:hypothetical protein